MTNVLSSSKGKAVVLVSGGLDSATVLAMAVEQSYECYALSVDYGQRHGIELKRAALVARNNGATEHRVVKIDIGGFGGSALTDNAIDVPIEDLVKEAGEQSELIPVTYVPARNTVFLSVALGWAEVLGAKAIFIGANAVDYSGYPDCRPEFIASFQAMANLATKAGVEGDTISIEAPLLSLAKADIIKAGMSLGVDYSDTISCYNPGGKGQACHQCDSCRIREAGFAMAGIVDPVSA